MGNEYSSPQGSDRDRDRDRDDYGDGESTVMSGTSGWSYDTRDQKERMRKSVGSSNGKDDKGSGGKSSDNFPYAAGLIDQLCGRMVFEEEDEYSPSRDRDDKKKKKNRDRDRDRGRRSGRSHSEDYSDDDTYTYDSAEQDRKEAGGKKAASLRDNSNRSSKSKKSGSNSHDVASPDFSSYDEGDRDRDHRDRDSHKKSSKEHHSHSHSLEGDGTETDGTGTDTEIDPYGPPSPAVDGHVKPSHSASFDDNLNINGNGHGHGHGNGNHVLSPMASHQHSPHVQMNMNSTPMSMGGMGSKQPLASAFAKRCYFTKAGISPMTQHYEGVTLTGNTVLMLASAMKLKGCPTICDEDLRRVEQTYPNQFSRLPDELLLSSGWRRISKYCHFSGKPIPDGVPFFHSRDRLHPQTGGYYFLLASSLGMERPSDVEPLTIDMLILLQTDYPSQCDQAPLQLLEDPNQWTLVTKFCFFSGGPINDAEDVYYEADFNTTPIFMLAFLSPNLTPEELYRLNDITGENALKSVAAVEEVDQVYNLTERDFDDLRLYHLGPCRALPTFIISPEAWKKVLPISFVECREKALARAFEFETHAQEAIARASKLLGNGPTGPAHDVALLQGAQSMASMAVSSSTPRQGTASMTATAAASQNEYVEFNKSQEPSPDYDTKPHAHMGVDLDMDDVDVAQDPSFSPRLDSILGSASESPMKGNMRNGRNQFDRDGENGYANNDLGVKENDMDLSLDEDVESNNNNNEQEHHFGQHQQSDNEHYPDPDENPDDEIFHAEEDYDRQSHGHDRNSLSPRRSSRNNNNNDASDPELSVPPYDTSEEFPLDEPDFDIRVDHQHPVPVIPPDVHRSTRGEQEVRAFGGGGVNGAAELLDEGTNEELDDSHYQSIGKGSEDQLDLNVTPPSSPMRSRRSEKPNNYRREESPQTPSSNRQVSFRDESKDSPTKSPIKSSKRNIGLRVETSESDPTNGNGVIDVPDPSPRLDFVSPLSTPGVGHFSDYGEDDESPLKESSLTPQSQTSEYSRSSAMRGAQELLKKNRQQRLAIMAKRRSGKDLDSPASTSNIENKAPMATSMSTGTNTSTTKAQKTIYSRSRNRSVTPNQLGGHHSHSQAPASKSGRSLSNGHSRSASGRSVLSKDRAPKSPVKMTMYKSPSASSKVNSQEQNSNNEELSPKVASPIEQPESKMLDESDVKSDATSAFSGSSSVWTETTEVSERDQRRALILKMAKNRMKSKREALA